MEDNPARLSEPPPWTLADRIRKVRRTLGLTQAELAAKLGVTQAALARYEAETATPPDVVWFARQMEDATGVSAVWLLGLDGDASAGRQPSPAGRTAGRRNRRTLRTVEHPDSSQGNGSTRRKVASSAHEWAAPGPAAA